MSDAISSQLAAHTETGQVDMVRRADVFSSRLDGIVLRAMRELKSSLGKHNRLAVHAAIARMESALATIIDDYLTGIARRAHADASRTLATTLPIEYLQAMLGSRELLEATPGIIRAVAAAQGLLGPQSRGAAGPSATAEELLKRFPKSLSEKRLRQFYQDSLWPQPLPAKVRKIVRAKTGRSTWGDRLRQATKLAAPQRVASIIEIGFAQGRTQEEIADDLLPLFQGVASSARRVARDETVRIANELKFEADERMGELLVGYQVRAVLDERTRPKHRERNGTIYYKDPKPGQRGYDSMPRPPLESPRDGSKLAYFCRCSLSAILRPIPKREREAMVSPPTPYRDRDRRLVPDPQVYSEWFRKADDKRRKIAVGPRRYAEVKDLIRGQRPSWEHFLDPETGEMMKLDDLRRETVDERRDRVRQTRNLIARRPSLATLAAR